MEYQKLTLAGCVILNSAGGILLLHRNTPKRTQWELPGGKLEKGETARKAAIREIKEELGVAVKISKKLGFKDFIEDDYVMTYTWFLADMFNGVPEVKEKDKFDDLRYFTWRELENIKENLSDNTHNLLEAYLSGKITLD